MGAEYRRAAVTRLTVYRWTAALLEELRAAAVELGITEVLPGLMSREFNPHAAVAVLGAQDPPAATLALFAGEHERVHVRGHDAFYVGGDCSGDARATLAYLGAVFYMHSRIMPAEEGRGLLPRTMHEFRVELNAPYGAPVNVAERLIAAAAGQLLLSNLDGISVHDRRSALTSLRRVPYLRGATHGPAWHLLGADADNQLALHLPNVCSDAVVVSGMGFGIRVELVLAYALAAHVRDVLPLHDTGPNSGYGLASCVLPLEPAPPRNIWHLD